MARDGGKPGIGGKRARGRLLGPCLALSLALGASSAGAQQPEAGSGAPGQPVQLDQLLKLPSGLNYGIQTRGGMTPGEWRKRFAEIEGALNVERKALELAQAKLADAAGSQENWQVAPALPGVAASAADSPVDYALRQDIKRHRAEIERLERQLRDLEIEANLAGVPDEWRG